MDKFSPKTLEYLNEDGKGYYVYALVDPRNNEIFYIGKGIDNRVFNHEKDVKKDKSSETIKVERIKEIINSGKEVKHYILNYHLFEDEAYNCEATAINLMKLINSKLTNIVSGHHCNFAISTENFEMEHGALPVKIDSNDKIVVIKVNKLYKYNLAPDKIYDIVRGIWRANIKRVKKADYVFGVYNGLIVACYKPIEWHVACDVKEDLLPKNVKRPLKPKDKSRVFFDADINYTDNNIENYNKKIIDNYSQNPITYINY